MILGVGVGVAKGAEEAEGAEVGVEEVHWLRKSP